MQNSKSAITMLLMVLLLGASALFAATLDKETAELIKKAGGKEKYPDANALLIKQNTLYEFNVDGTCKTTEYFLAKILTESGFKDYGEMKLPYYKTYDSIVVKSARVIKHDGSIVEVPADMIKDISDASTEEMNIYESDARNRVISFKNLEVGDCVELLVEDHLHHPPMDNEFDGMEIFQLFDPILYKEATVIGPKSKPLRHVTMNGNVKFSEKQMGDKVKYTWTAENVDRIIQEPAMPALTEIAPTVIFSTIDSWETVSKWWNEMAGKQMELNDAMRAEVKTLTDGKGTRNEKVDAIYHYVAQKVRYMGLGTGKKKGCEPKPVIETYETKYGVCRDVAAMMVAMLREADVPAEVVLTNMGSKVAYDIPHFGFNHAIVAIKNDDGSFTYADPTVDNSVDWLPAVESKQQVLVCTPEGKTLADTPLTPAKENMGKIKAVSNLTEEGVFTSEVTIATDGIYDLALRSFAKSMPSAQMSMIWNYVIQDVYPGAKLTNFSFSDAENLELPFEIKFSYQVDKYPTEAGEFVLMKSPVSRGSFELISKFLLSSASLPERKYPYNLGFTFGASEEETITLPAGMKLKSMPDAVSESKGPVEYRMTYQSANSSELASGGTQVTYQKEIMINAKEMSPAEYAQFKEVLKTASKSARGELIMQREGSEN